MSTQVQYDGGTSAPQWYVQGVGGVDRIYLAENKVVVVRGNKRIYIPFSRVYTFESEVADGTTAG